MEYNDVGVVVLAAGKGTRMKSNLAKVLHKVAGKCMVLHVIECAAKIVRDNVVVVVGHQAQAVKKEVRKQFEVNFALQEQLLGTGDAVKTAIPVLAANIKDVLVLCGDVPLIQENTLRNMIRQHKKSQAKVSVLAVDVDNPAGYGRIILDSQNQMQCIREESDASDIEKQIKTVNTGIYCFDRGLLASVIADLKPDNNQAEYYLTDVVEIARKRDEKIAVVTMDDPDQVIWVNTLDELEKAGHLIQAYGK